MTPDPPERDPLADLVARSIGSRVDAVTVETLASEHAVERKRLRYATAAGESSAVFERLAPGEVVEAKLVPFLARKSDRVPAVHSRGLPPPHAKLGPWILIEDVYGGAPGCDGDVREIVRAKLAIERAIAGDLPALRALGLPDVAGPLPVALADAPATLVHGALGCSSALRVARGVVLVGWRAAMIGPAAFDHAMLARDLRAAGREEDARAVRECYLGESGSAAAERWFDAAAAMRGGTAGP